MRIHRFKKSASDHKSDCVPVSAMAETSSWVFEVSADLLFLALAGVSTEMVIETLGWSRRRVRCHSPLVKM